MKMAEENMKEEINLKKKKAQEEIQDAQEYSQEV